MVFSQRNGTSAITLNTQGSVIFDFDRWSRQIYQAGKLTLQQVTDAPSGFSYSIKATTVSAITGSSADYYQFNQPIEGFNTAHLAYGTSSARTTTLSFWVKSTLTGKWSGAVKNSASNRAYTFSYYINSPSTWEYKTVTIPGDTSGTWIGSTNGIGLRLMYDLGTSRTDLQGTLNSWTATNSYASSTGVKLVQNASATWQITGVQLEVGKVATPFEHRSYGEELALCQRYFTVMPNGILGVASSTTSVVYSYHLPTQMRATPSVSLTSTNQRQGDTVAQGISLTSASISISTYANSSVAAFSISGTPSANFTPYRTYLYEGTGSFPAQVHLSAEL